MEKVLEQNATVSPRLEYRTAGSRQVCCVHCLFACSMEEFHSCVEVSHFRACEQDSGALFLPGWLLEDKLTSVPARAQNNTPRLCGDQLSCDSGLSQLSLPWKLFQGSL